MAQCAVPKTSDTIREAPNCETESVPAFRLSVDSLLRSNKGNGNGGNSVRKGESFTPPLAECFGWLSSSPKSPDGYRFAILALTVKLWLAVPYARRKNASAFSALLVVTEVSLPRGSQRGRRFFEGRALWGDAE